MLELAWFGVKFWAIMLVAGAVSQRIAWRAFKGGTRPNPSPWWFAGMLVSVVVSALFVLAVLDGARIMAWLLTGGELDQ